MIRLITFFIGWAGGIFIFNEFVFKTLFQFIRNETHVASLSIMLIVVYTVIWGLICGIRK